MLSTRMISVVGAAVSILSLASAGQAQIGAGDLLPIAVNTAAGTQAFADGFALVALRNIAAGSVLYITDNELTAATGTVFNTGESYSRWTAPAGGVAAGTVINFTNFDATGTTLLNVSTGSVSAVTFANSSNRGLSATSESLYFYTAASDASADTATGFVSFLNIGTTADPAPASLNPNFNISIVSTAGPDAAQYTGPRAGSSAFTDYAALIGDVANNWTTAGATDPNAFNTTAFTIIPTPGTAALLGLGGLVVARRRRN